MIFLEVSMCSSTHGFEIFQKIHDDFLFQSGYRRIGFMFDPLDGLDWSVCCRSFIVHCKMQPEMLLVCYLDESSLVVVTIA